MKNYVKMFNSFFLNESEWNDDIGPLADAVADDELSIVRALLNSGANPNIVAQDGMAPLELAVKNGNYEMVELLVKHGARAEPKQLSFFEQESMDATPDLYAVIDTTVEGDIGPMLGIFPNYEDGYNYYSKIVITTMHDMIQDLMGEGFESREDVVQYYIDTNNIVCGITSAKELLESTTSSASHILKKLMSSNVSDEIKEKYAQNLGRISKVKKIFNK